jgi:delta(3,5)-delta(2,4)-dienoyl-CoA isomerase
MSQYQKFDLYKVSFPEKNVLHIELNRPSVLNAVNRDSYLQFGEIFEIAKFDPEVRVIVLSGVGRAFCAGLDISSVSSLGGSDQPQESSRKAIALYHHIKEFQKAIYAPHTVNKPVIGVAHGPSVGLALDILSAVDIRYASKDAKLSIREIEIGMAADIGSLQRLPKIVNNIGWLKEVCLTGRIFSAEEAQQQGLINRVFETKEIAVGEAIGLAKIIAAKSPVAAHGTKKSINYALEHSIDDGLEQIAEFNAHALGEDLVKGAMSAMSKDKPTYEKL